MDGCIIQISGGRSTKFFRAIGSGDANNLFCFYGIPVVQLSIPQFLAYYAAKRVREKLQQQQQGFQPVGDVQIIDTETDPNMRKAESIFKATKDTSILGRIMNG